MKKFWASMGSLALALGLMHGAIAAQGAQETVQRAADQVLSKVKAERDLLRADPTQLQALVNDVLIPHFDFRRISQWVLGRYWPEATDEQRIRFAEEFRNLLVRTYATALLEYSDQEIRYLPVQADEGASNVIVRTEIQQPGGPVMPVNYRMHRRDDGWKVFDVAIDNVSLVSTYRASFAAEIRRDGLDGLIQNLAARNRERMQ